MKGVQVKEFEELERGFPKMPTAVSQAEVRVRKTINNMPSQPEEKRKRINPDPIMMRGGISEKCRFWGCTLDNYKVKSKSELDAMKEIQRYMSEKKYENGEGLVLFGEPGTGKTHLLIGLMWEFAKIGKTVKYMTAEDFFIRLRQSITDRNELGYLNSLIDPDVLVFDDLHCVGEEEGYQYRQLWWMLDKRYFHKKPTLTASNKSIDEFREAFDDRTRRRLCANAIPVKK